MSVDTRPDDGMSRIHRLLRYIESHVLSGLALTLLLATLAFGCGGGASSMPLPSDPASKVVSVVPSCASPLASGASETCTVVVTGTGNFNHAVTWSASSGTISSAGVFTAPTVTAATSVTVTATSVEGSVQGSAMVNITPTPPPAVTSVTVTCATPISSAATSQCSASVTPAAAPQGVTWSVSAGASISQTGLLTAPTVTANQTVMVTATSAAAPTVSGSFTVTVDAPSPPAVTSVTVTCATPVPSAGTSQCTATVAPAGAPQTLTWSASTGASISQTGLLTAPAVTANQPVTVTATSVATPTISGSFVVTVDAPASATGPENLGVGSAPSTVVDPNGVIDIAWITQSGIVFSQSQDHGVTFSAANLVLPLPIISEQMNIQLDAQNDIVIFATYNTGAGAATAMLARSTDGGKAFTNLPVSQNGLFPVLLVEPGGALDLAYLDVLTSALHESRSTDGGKTFSTDQVLWTTTQDAVDLQGVIGPQGQIYFAWSQESGTTCAIFFTASVDDKTFSKPVQLSNDAGCDVDPTPLVDASGNVNIAWVSSGKTLYFTRSTDQGQTFAKLATVTQNGISLNAPNFVVAPSGEIDLVYQSLAIGANYEVFFTQSPDDGATFSTPISLTLPPVPNFTGGGDPSVGVDITGKITVAWEDDGKGTFSGDNDIYVSTSTDGKTFSSPTDISNTTDQIEVFPMVIETPTGLRYITWYDTTGQQTNPVLSVFFYAVQ
jgi:hypothetical protein